MFDLVKQRHVKTCQRAEVGDEEIDEVKDDLVSAVEVAVEDELTHRSSPEPSAYSSAKLLPMTSLENPTRYMSKVAEESKVSYPTRTSY